MGTCPDCGTSGQANRDCATQTSALLWDGGALCIGISDGTLNDIIAQMAIAICNISTSLSGVGVTAANVAITGQIGGCITTSAYLSTWVTNVETYLCSLGTTVTGLDFTEPLYYSDEDDIIAASASPVVVDTITIPANTLNEDYEYLKLELWGYIKNYPSANCKMTVAFLGQTLTFDFIGIEPCYERMKVELVFTRTTSSVAQYDWVRVANRWKNIQVADVYVSAVDISPVDWTIANDMVISCNNSTGNFYRQRVRLTKFNVH